MKILLHCCCGPCTSGVFPVLAREGHEVTGFYTNPNIHPAEEYRLRLESLQRYAGAVGMPLEIEEEYLPERYFAALGDDRREGYRCRDCYAVRLGAAAVRARATGDDAFTTTLLISPYQDQEWIKLAGEEAGRRAGVPFLFQDFRPWYRQSIERSKEMGLYRQKYCGCSFSLAESKARRAQREAERAAKPAASAATRTKTKPAAKEGQEEQA